MKYLDILKNYDKAIITESAKLKEIYNDLVKEGCCDGEEKKDEKELKEEKYPDCGKDEKECECNKMEITEDMEKEPSEKTMTEFDEACDELAEDKMQKKDEYYGQEGNSEDGGETMTKDEFFAGADTTEETQPEDSESTENAKVEAEDTEQKNESEGEEGKPEETSTETTETETEGEVENSEPTEDSTQEETPSEDNADTGKVMSAEELFAGDSKSEEPTEEVKEAAETSSGTKFDNAKQWLDSLKESDEDKTEEDSAEETTEPKEEIKEEPKSDEPNSEEETKEPVEESKEEKKDEEDKKEPEEEEMSEEDKEIQELKESTEAIRQFVKANKKLFFTEK